VTPSIPEQIFGAVLPYMLAFTVAVPFVAGFVVSAVLFHGRCW
jgi:hypothetical protein